MNPFTDNDRGWFFFLAVNVLYAMHSEHKYSFWEKINWLIRTDQLLILIDKFYRSKKVVLKYQKYNW